MSHPFGSRRGSASLRPRAGKWSVCLSLSERGAKVGAKTSGLRRRMDLWHREWSRDQRKDSPLND